MSRWVPSVAVLACVGVLTATVLPSTNALADPIEGSQGTDTSLPATESLAVAHGRDQFSNLEITVNQTAKLSNQTVSITWTGAAPTITGPGRFAQNYLQIFQCWGDDDGTISDNPGPPPEQCEQGGYQGKYGGLPTSAYPDPTALSRIISVSTWGTYDPTVGVLDPRTKFVWRPFRAVDGTTVDIQTDPKFNPSFSGGDYWRNQYYNFVTTNEIPGAPTGPDGNGAELMQLLTGRQSSGLGCGQKSQPDGAGGKKIPQCWIVVVPRGTAADENANTPFGNEDAATNGVVTSPISTAAWKNRIAIPISFNPVDSPCTLGADERRIAGSELALAAVARWQPALCASSTTLPPYSYAKVPDNSARLQLTSTAQGAPGMVVVSQPLAPAASPPQNPIVYAPISTSGLVIAFNVERFPNLAASAAENRLAGVRVSDISLTPRLVAKLLTQSYQAAVTIQAAPDYPWMAANPVHFGVDPDFLHFNPEFAMLASADSRAFAGLQLPAGTSDAAQQIWAWVLADPEARMWLAGSPDEWGMRVNPYYSTVAATNPSGIAFGDPIPNSFPKADPYCYHAAPRGLDNAVVPPALCGTDWIPYARGFTDAAVITRNASDGAKIVENPFAIDSSAAWSRSDPQFLGRRGMLAVTDTASAALFGLQTARLSRAGDDSETRRFIEADDGSMQAGVFSMSARTDPSVLETDPLADAPDAYPLTTMTYAAIQPLKLNAEARDQYATFLEYAAGPGQTPGFEYGQLPKGYAPLLPALRTQTLNAAQTVRTLEAPPPETTSTSVEDTTSTSTTVAPASITSTTIATPAIEATTPAAEPTTPQQSGGGSVPRPSGPTNPSSPLQPPATTQPPVTSAASVEPESSAATDAPVPDETVTSTTDESTTDSPTTTAAPTTTSSSVLMPFTKIAKSRYTVPGLGVVALGSALGAMEISRRPRRRVRASTTAGSDGDGVLGPGPDEESLP